MSIRVLIVDDEAPTRQLLSDLCHNQRDLHLVDPCSSATAAIKRLAGGGVDLLLLDIQLGPLTGFDVLHEVPPLRMPLVIFVTAYEQHAVRAFEERAIDYLLKPVNEVRFNKAIERARQQLARPADMAGLQDQLRAALLPLQRAVLAATHRDSLPYLVAERQGAYHVIGVQQIEYIDVEAESNYVSVHVAGESDPCLKRDTLQALISALDSREFLRVRRNCIVNLEHVERIERVHDDYHMVLKTGLRVTVGRSYRQAVSTFLRASSAQATPPAALSIPK